MERGCAGSGRQVPKVTRRVIHRDGPRTSLINPAHVGPAGGAVSFDAVSARVDVVAGGRGDSHERKGVGFSRRFDDRYEPDDQDARAAVPGNAAQVGLGG
jgi:hypothetical protein